MYALRRQGYREIGGTGRIIWAPPPFATRQSSMPHMNQAMRIDNVLDSIGLFTAMFFLGVQGAAAANGDAGATAMPSPMPASDRKIVLSAMRAAPKKVAAAATIVAMEDDGRLRTVRAGSNGFTCMPDNPATPGPDPMCLDPAALEWAQAWMRRQPPPTGKPGFVYMLAGGTDASNTDPYATRPEKGNHWLQTGPHVMIVGADASFYAMYPQNAEPDTEVPYVMWPKTVYQHLMIPVH